MLSEEEKKAIEHNRFDTSSGEGEYKITFETNNKNNYLFMQELARLFIDRNYKPKEFERLKLNNEYLQKDCNSLKEIIEKQNKIIKEQSYTNKKIRRTLKTVRKERNRQNKIIDKMAENVFLMNGDRGCTKQEIIEYFTKLVEEER